MILTNLVKIWISSIKAYKKKKVGKSQVIALIYIRCRVWLIIRVELITIPTALFFQVYSIAVYDEKRFWVKALNNLSTYNYSCNIIILIIKLDLKKNLLGIFSHDLSKTSKGLKYKL